MPLTEPSTQHSETVGVLSTLLSRPMFVALALAVCAAVLIWANWNSPFYNYDDADHLQLATEESISSIVRFDQEVTYFPVASLSLRLDRALFGPPFSQRIFKSYDEGSVPLDVAAFKAQQMWAAGSRLESAILHVVAGVLLWIFLRRIGASPGLAFFTAAAWTVHPMACESVCWISERKNVLMALFGFAAMLTWSAGSGVWWRWPLLSLFYLLSATSKPVGVGFFPIFVALEILHPPAGNNAMRVWRDAPKSTARLAAPVLITIFIVWLGIKIHRTVFVEHLGGSLFTALLTDIDIFARYIGNTLLPQNLGFFYGVDPIVSFSDFRLWIYGFCIAGFIGAVVFLSTGIERLLSILGIVWFFAAVGPVANIAPIPYPMHDRFIYVSSAGLLLSFGCGVFGLLKRFGSERIAPIAGALFVGMLFIFSAARSPLFTDSDLLSLDAAEKFHDSAFAQINAYAVIARNIQNLSSISGRDAAQTREYFIREAKKYYDNAIRRGDLTHFREAFKFRVDHAEMLMENGFMADAVACLDGFLPPAHLKMRDLKQEFRGSEFTEFYAPQTLARAWLVVAQVRLAQANPPGVSLERLPLKRRFELCDEAAAALAKSLAAFDWNQQVPYFAAAVELTRVELSKLAHRPDDALKFKAAARKRLEAISTTSPFYLNARKLLETQ